MTSNRDRAAEIIAPWIEKEWGLPEDNAESAATALADAGLLVPDLPAPVDVLESPGTIDAKFRDGGPGRNVIASHYPTARPGYENFVWIHDEMCTPEQAREIAVAILAAADHAEKATTKGTHHDQ